ncbi:hypothetical protein BC940DRAFT_246221, partial [Gongronella butleri]
VDRRPLDPPPIIQLFTNQSEHSYSRFFLYASLVDKDGDVDLTLRDHSRTTAGMVVQSLHKLKDMNDQGTRAFSLPLLDFRTWKKPRHGPLFFFLSFFLPFLLSYDRWHLFCLFRRQCTAGRLLSIKVHAV